MDTVELMMAAGKDMSEDASAAMKKATADDDHRGARKPHRRREVSQRYEYKHAWFLLLPKCARRAGLGGPPFSRPGLLHAVVSSAGARLAFLFCDAH